MPLISDRFSDDRTAVLELSDIQRKYIDIFNEKCRNKEYTFTKRNCECGSDDLEIIAQKDRYGISMDTVICRTCGLIMTNPCLDEDSNNRFYDNEYPYIYRAEEAPSEKVFLDRKKAAGSIITFIKKHTGISSGSVLEIGCADGRNVAAFAENGYDAKGIDLSHKYVEFGKSRGLDLECTDAASFEKKGLKFDLIVLNHVLEHFIDIGRELAVIRKMLKPKGCLFVAVPGVKALTFGAYDADFLRLLQNAHIFNFTRSTLCSVMEKYGFGCIYANEFIYSVFDLKDRVQELSGAYEDTMKYLHRLEGAHGNIQRLLIERAHDKISSFKNGEVLLYGTARELDAIVRDMESVSPVKGFFYSDSKTPADVAEFIHSSKTGCKCLVVADHRRNKVLVDSFTGLLGDDDPELFSVYTEIF